MHQHIKYTQQRKRMTIVTFGNTNDINNTSNIKSHTPPNRFHRFIDHRDSFDYRLDSEYTIDSKTVHFLSLRLSDRSPPNGNQITFFN